MIITISNYFPISENHSLNYFEILGITQLSASSATILSDQEDLIKMETN